MTTNACQVLCMWILRKGSSTNSLPKGTKTQWRHRQSTCSHLWGSYHLVGPRERVHASPCCQWLCCGWKHAFPLSLAPSCQEPAPDKQAAGRPSDWQWEQKQVCIQNKCWPSQSTESDSLISDAPASRRHEREIPGSAAFSTGSKAVPSLWEFKAFACVDSRGHNCIEENGHNKISRHIWGDCLVNKCLLCMHGFDPQNLREQARRGDMHLLSWCWIGGDRWVSPSPIRQPAKPIQWAPGW